MQFPYEDQFIWSKDQLKRYLLRRTSTGRRFIFFEDYLEVMSIEEAVVVQKIVNAMSNSKLSKDGWVLCSVKFLSKYADPRRQSRILKSLIGLGFIDVKKKGLPPKRYVKVDILMIESAIDQATQGAKSVILKPDKMAPIIADKIDTQSMSSSLQDSDTREPPGGSLGYTEGHPSCGEDTDMPLFPEHQNPPKGYSPADLKFAKAHRQFTARTGLYTASKNATWAKEVAVCKRALGEDRFADLTSAYYRLCDKYGFKHKDCWLPPILNPKGFRSERVVNKIEEAVHNDAKMAGNDPATLEVSADAKRAAGYVEHLGWPKGSKSQLPAACQRVITGFTKFRDDLKGFCKLHPQWVQVKGKPGTVRPAPPHVSLAHHLLKCVQGHPADFAESWMRKEFARVQNWDDWSGNLFKQVWDGRLDHKEFQKYMRGLAGAYSERPGDWDKLAEELR